MRYRHITAIIILLACTLQTTAQNLSEIYSKERPVVFVCDWDNPPYEFLNDEGEPAGSNVDVIKAVMKKLELPCTFVMKERTVALKAFERGDGDVILANGRHYKNSPYFISENIINYNRVRVATHNDTLSIVTMGRLEQEGAVFKPGDYSATYLLEDDSANVNLIEYQSPKVALLGLINGDYKYFVWGEEPLKWKIKELNLEGITLNDVGIPISEIHFVSKNRQLIDEIDDQYSRLKQSGDIAVIQDRWMHPERVKPESTYTILYIAVGVVLLAAILYLFSRLARRHVRRVTRNSTELNEMMSRALHMGNFDIMQYDIAKDLYTNRYGNILPEEGMTLEEFIRRIHPDQREEFIQKSRSLHEGRERHFKLDKRWNQGTEENPHYLNFQGHAICELDKNGRPAYVINAVYDVTQDMEEDLAARNLVHKYDVIANNPFVAMSFYDSKGNLIEHNDAMKQLCGIRDDDPDLRRFWKSINLFDATLFKGAITPEERYDMLFCQHLLYPEYGIDKYVECQIHPLYNAEGEIANYLITTFDLTEERNRDRDVHLLERERQQTEERIRQQHEQLQNLLRYSDRHLMRSNIIKEEIAFFRSPETPEYTYNFSRLLQMIEEPDRELMKHFLYDTTTSMAQQITIHMILPPEGQTGTIFNISFHPITDAEGHIIGHTGIATDITCYEQTCRQYETQKQLAKESVRMKSGFMASMTHELRTPLNAIIGFTGVLDNLDDTTGRAEYVRIIRNSSDMLQRLINDIIEASTITDGAITIKPEQVDFCKAFNDICITLKRRVQNPEVKFIKENPYEHFYTELDVERILQVMTNFVTNAVKFTKEGHIKVGYRYQNHGLYLYCEDTGSGIPQDKQELVFERFTKLDEFVQGTGMGLAISKSIAESCKGKIGLHSEGAGKGSTFWVWIPCERRLSS